MKSDASHWRFINPDRHVSVSVRLPAQARALREAGGGMGETRSAYQCDSPTAASTTQVVAAKPTSIR
jgi:hypothetical protein